MQYNLIYNKYIYLILNLNRSGSLVLYNYYSLFNKTIGFTFHSYSKLSYVELEYYTNLISICLCIRFDLTKLFNVKELITIEVYD